jgi:hypothetical protein
VTQFTTQTNQFLNTNRHIYEVMYLANNANGDIVSSENPLPVTLGTENITIQGNISIPTSVEISNDVGNPIPVSGNVSIDTNSLFNIRLGDSPSASAFGRLRVAGTSLLGEFRNKYGTFGPVEIITVKEGSGNTVADLSNTVSYLTATTASGDRSLRQSRRYHPYIPGTTQYGLISFCFDEAKANVQQMVGMFDDKDGIFLRMNGTTLELVIRKSNTDVEIVTQNDWNIDKFDGTGTEEIVIDFTKAQVLVIDYQWLGVGRVRIGFNLNGQIYYAHYFSHANSVQLPYTNEPSLPVRWEIKNTGNTTSNTKMTAICYGVYSEGNEFETGFDNSVSSGRTAITLAASPNDVKGILAVRLKNSVNGIPMKAFARLKEWEVVTDLNVNYKVLLLQSTNDITAPGGGAVTWNDVVGLGWTQYTTDFRLATENPTNSVVIFDGYSLGGGGTGANKSSRQTDLSIENRLASIFQNYNSTDSMIFAIVAYRIGTNNANLFGSMQWIEIK